MFPALDSIRELQLEGTIQAKVHMAKKIVNLAVFARQEVAASRERADKLYEELQIATQDAGYQQYRTGTLGNEGLYRLCPEYGELLSRIKTSLDPAGILSPGKYEIMPRRDRTGDGF